MCSHASSSWFSSRIISNISGGHWASFSAATIWTLRLRLCDLPRDLISLCSTCIVWNDERVGSKSEKNYWSMLIVYFWRGDLQIDDKGRQRSFGQLRWMIDRIAIQDDQLKGRGKKIDSINHKWDWMTVTNEYDITWRVLANSKMRSISAWTSAMQLERELERSINARFEGLLSSERLAREMSALTLVMMILRLFVKK